MSCHFPKNDGVSLNSNFCMHSTACHLTKRNLCTPPIFIYVSLFAEEKKVKRYLEDNFKNRADLVSPENVSGGRDYQSEDEVGRGAAVQHRAGPPGPRARDGKVHLFHEISTHLSNFNSLKRLVSPPHSHKPQPISLYTTAHS